MPTLSGYERCDALALAELVAATLAPIAELE